MTSAAHYLKIHLPSQFAWKQWTDSATHKNFKYYSQTIGGWIWMIPEDLTNGV